MKWIKASENRKLNLPSKGAFPPFRVLSIGSPVPYTQWVFVEANGGKDDYIRFYLNLDATPTRKILHNFFIPITDIEWLDESEPSITAEGIEKWYRDWLDKKETKGIDIIQMLKDFASQNQTEFTLMKDVASGPTTTDTYQPGGYSRGDMINALTDFIAYRGKAGTADIASNAKDFESHFWQHEKVSHL